MSKRGRKVKDLTGQRFGYLVCSEFLRTEVVERHGRRINNHTWWNCICDCGSQVEVDAKHLKDGSCKSCGCLQREITSAISKNTPSKERLRMSRSYKRKAEIVEGIISGEIGDQEIAAIILRDAPYKTRNGMIAEDALKGLSYAEIGRRLLLTRSRIQQIAKAQGIQSIDTPRSKETGILSSSGV
jgi:hypothetical protein